MIRMHDERWLASGKSPAVTATMDHIEERKWRTENSSLAATRAALKIGHRVTGSFRRVKETRGIDVVVAERELPACLHPRG